MGHGYVGAWNVGWVSVGREDWLLERVNTDPAWKKEGLRDWKQEPVCRCVWGVPTHALVTVFS